MESKKGRQSLPLPLLPLPLPLPFFNGNSSRAATKRKTNVKFCKWQQCVGSLGAAPGDLNADFESAHPSKCDRCVWCIRNHSQEEWAQIQPPSVRDTIVVQAITEPRWCRGHSRSGSEPIPPGWGCLFIILNDRTY